MLVHAAPQPARCDFVKFKTSYKSLRLTARNLGYMTYIGFPALLSELAISCLMVVGNYTFIRYTGKDGVAAYSIACYIFPIIFMVYNGIIQSAQPIISYNYGAGLMRRGRDAFAMALGTAFVCGLAVFGFTWLFSPWIVGLFLTPDAPAYAIAVRGLPLFAAGYPFFGINVVTIGYYQSIERGRLATGLTVSSGHRADGFLLPRAAAAGGRRGDLARGTGGRTGRNTAPARTAAHRLRDEAVNGEREQSRPAFE